MADLNRLLVPGGLLLYETFLKRQNVMDGPRNPTTSWRTASCSAISAAWTSCFTKRGFSPSGEAARAGALCGEEKMIVEWNPARPKKKTTALIKESLENGAIISYPTDTFYGLGCDLFNIKAIKTLYAMRGLSEKRPLSIIFKDIKDISDYAVLTDFAFHILKSTLPGAYTFILKAKRIVPRLLMTQEGAGGEDAEPRGAPGARQFAGKAHNQYHREICRAGSHVRPKGDRAIFQESGCLVIDGGLIGASRRPS